MRSAATHKFLETLADAIPRSEIEMKVDGTNIAFAEQRLSSTPKVIPSAQLRNYEFAKYGRAASLITQRGSRCDQLLREANTWARFALEMPEQRKAIHDKARACFFAAAEANRALLVKELSHIKARDVPTPKTYKEAVTGSDFKRF